jgi:UDP-N-acetylmuramoyl-L-alanyl-D-glutamate--2,6-diaminopimelate ligase
MTTGAIALSDLLAAVEPTAPRPLGGLVDRLLMEGRLREARRDGRVVGTAGLAGLGMRGIVDDSRRIRSGFLFVAIPGGHTDGHHHAAAAIAAGAVAVIVERPLNDAGGVQLVVDRSSAALASAAAWWYGDPSRELGVVGITGTDGKTTTSFLVAAALEAAGLRSGLVGTVETRVGRIRERTAEHVTTPGAIEVHRLLRAMVTGGDAVAVIETTSHGLATERVGGVAYDAAIMTNLSHEHLEFHGTFEAYRAAKLRLFERLGRRRPDKARPFPRVGVVNCDDPSAPLFQAAVRGAGARLVTYGLDPDADVRATSVEEDSRRLRVGVRAPDWEGRLELRLVGRFNVHNALAALALGIGWGLDPEAVRTGLEGVTGVPGRMERIEVGQPFGVIVDYAHSPAALQGVLDLLAPIVAPDGGLIAVFGSAGERDTAKRPLMGRIAGERCRLVVVTDEDPRDEDREAILSQIAAGAESAGRQRSKDLLVIPDRAEAIAAAFGRAGPGDLVLLAGKGHERSIIGPDGPMPWDERAVALAALAALGYREA